MLPITDEMNPIQWIRVDWDGIGECMWNAKTLKREKATAGWKAPKVITATAEVVFESVPVPIQADDPFGRPDGDLPSLGVKYADL